MSRADLMHAALVEADGNWVSRQRLFRHSQRFYLTNNASSEIRAKYGVEVEHKLIDGEHCYRLSAGRERALVTAPPDNPPCAEPVPSPSYPSSGQAQLTLT